VQIISADRETLLNAYEVSTSKNHDVYDSLLVSLARTHEGDVLLTTDTDFKTSVRTKRLRIVIRCHRRYSQNSSPD